MGLTFTVTHLTRMRGERICVAGLTDDGQFVRPDCYGYLQRSDVPELFSLGARVDLGPVESRPERPQTENVRFKRKHARKVRIESPEQFERVLAASAVADLVDAFGDGLARSSPRGTLRVTARGAQCSLATLKVPADSFLIRIDAYDRARARWTDPCQGDGELPVTDLRIHPDPDGPVDAAHLDALTEELSNCDELYLSVGLSKLWGPEGGLPAHWLQLNNVLPVLRPPRHRWPMHTAERLDDFRRRYPAVIEKYPRAWAAWNGQEDSDLCAAYEAGVPTAELAKRHQRKPGAITSRLKKLGLVT